MTGGGTEPGTFTHNAQDSRTGSTVGRPDRCPTVPHGLYFMYRHLLTHFSISGHFIKIADLKVNFGYGCLLGYSAV
jgi:hypothetical protein